MIVQLLRKRMCQLIWVWLQRSITHQQWQHTNTNRHSSVNSKTDHFTAAHTSRPNIILHRLTGTKPDTHTCTAMCNPQTRNCMYGESVCTEAVAPYWQEEDVQSQISANVYQHIREEPKQPVDTWWLKIKGVYREEPNTIRCASAKFNWSSESSWRAPY